LVAELTYKLALKKLMLKEEKLAHEETQQMV
jgi:hypothetical protein